MTRHKKRGIKLRSMYQWHRYVGINIAIFILILSITGIMLNHTNKLNLNKEYIKSEWLLNHYGISAPEKTISFHTGTQWISQWENTLYLDGHSIGKIDKNILGTVFFQDMIVIAQDDALLIYTQKGELIERIAGSEGVPPGIEAIGVTDKNQLAVRAANGVFTTNNELLFWSQSPSTISIWSDTAELPKTLYQTTLEQYRGKGLTLERIILDLHSGRLLGNWGIYFTDLIALFMMFLSLSGLWLWGMRTLKKKIHRKQ